MPYLKYHQDVRWIEWHTRLADPECDDPGSRPAPTLEQIAKDAPMSTWGMGIPSSYRLIERRRLLEQMSA